MHLSPRLFLVFISNATDHLFLQDIVVDRCKMMMEEHLIFLKIIETTYSICINKSIVDNTT